MLAGNFWLLFGNVERFTTMSRIGKKPVSFPASVKLSIAGDGQLSVTGPKGSLSWQLPKGVTASVENSNVVFDRESESRDHRAKHGLSRALVANMVTGVSVGFVRDLEIQGVGFKAAVKGAFLDLSLGFSHPVLFPIPDGIKITVTDNTKVKVEGIDRQLVGQVAANIRGYYPPEPYKGKGVRYAGEEVQRKEGKTVQ
jgi:large subunit ribosomal protein L6